MILDFKEIPQANKGGGLQDTFELFSRDFLELLNYKILEEPDRGADNKKDMIVEETLKGIGARVKKERWLVSCKHYAHSGRGVKDTDEPDISDRLQANNCVGFIGMYSTVPTTSLTNKLKSLNDRFEFIIFDREKIERELLDNLSNNLFVRYFPKSFENHFERLEKVENYKAIVTNNDDYDENRTTIKNAIFDSVMSVQLLLDFDRIKKHHFEESGRSADKKILKAIKGYAKYTTVQFSLEVYEYLDDITYNIKYREDLELLELIFSTATSYIPIYKKSNKEEFRLVVNLGIDMANRISSNSVFYSNSFNSLMYGLNIMKFFYTRLLGLGLDESRERIVDYLEELKESINETNSIDMELMIEMVNVYQKQIDDGDLSFPPFSNKLMNKIS